MQNIQEIFVRIQENKKKLKDLKSMYKDALAGAQEYQEILDKMKTLRERKKQIENTIKQDFASELTKMDDLKIDLLSDQEMISDAAITQMMKGETVAVTDEYQNEYEPSFSVKFKKIT